MKGYTIQNSIELLERNAGKGGSGVSSADQVSFDNTGTGINADNVQGALSELDSRTIKFGTPVAETIAGLNVVNAEHTFVNAGLASVNIVTSGSGNGYCYVTVNDVTYSGTTPSGYAGNLVIPVNAGDKLKITQISSGVSINAIKVVPILLAAPVTSNTKKTRRK